MPVPRATVCAAIFIVGCGDHANATGRSGASGGGGIAAASGAATGAAGSSKGEAGATTGVSASGGSAGALAGTTGAIGTSSGAGTTSGSSAAGSATSGTSTSEGGTTGIASGSASGSSGTSASSGTPVLTFKNYELTGTWLKLQAAIVPKPPTMPFVYKKITVGGVLGTEFLSESCAIGDYNNDGIPDVSSGHRWYEGPDFQIAHSYRSGHGALPRAGAETELQNGVSDDWADYPWDVDGDGLTDIVNIASPSYTTTVNWESMPQLDGTAFWYKNPGLPTVATDAIWMRYQISNDIKMEEHNLCDVNGDGKPEILASCHSCGGGTKGYYQGDWMNPTNPWTFHVVTRTYEFPFGGTGWQYGIGCGDVNGDGKPDLLERSGVWIQPTPLTEPWGGQASDADAGTVAATGGWVPQAFSVPALVAENNTGQGGSHMYAFDVDGDGDVDVVSADDASGWGLSWYEQTTPVESCLGSVATLETALTSCFTKHQIMATNKSASDLATYGVPYEGTRIASSELAAVQFVDMDGDGLPDIVTGKMRFELPYDQAYADPDGVPYLYIFKLVRDANPPESGKAHFEGHQIDPTCNETCWGNYLEGTTQTPCCTGVGRQIAIGHANLDGIPDICIASKLGLTVFLGQ